MKRRDFINWVGLGLIASSLPVAIAACSSQTTSATGDWQTVGTSADLDKTGQLLAKNSPAGPVLVVGTSKSASLTAVNPTCTHAGCTVAWKAEAKKFACPCHGSEYGVDGKVLKGPATEALKTYTAKIESNSVQVKPT
ncbi:MAG: ubiquinol-cytochrome c reductase iron-sulfur subunit [Nostoc sp. DedVER02]|uniref:QcrA and Rieske domain-containing protein n=1 Tax=unclassified Nostoc TaxID=2593658 RepID=UPI002AD4FA80|nr:MULTISPECIES: ubiquinol-cytochrome c reductase iron-sulfur subunit [unclassified Nostoc]MDZ7990008.1 ubiquinol-cytochrome c reductase iron-sulfur subunit [Nostoc sp. DedVER02]MDZ8111748.1 ubiquinol-cytochrome c reductase iron-sulfur subunit [Nostoc sp. DedVER01b]